jgi:hypothetical protein
VARTGEGRGTYIASVGKPYVDEQHINFRCRYENNIKRDL